MCDGSDALREMDTVAQCGGAGLARERRFELPRHFPGKQLQSLIGLCAQSRGGPAAAGDGEAWRNGEAMQASGVVAALRNRCASGRRGCFVAESFGFMRFPSSRRIPRFPSRVVAVAGLVQSLDEMEINAVVEEQAFPLSPYSHPTFLLTIIITAFLHIFCQSIFRVSHVREGTSAAKPAAAVRSTARSGSSKWAAPPP